MCCNALVSFGGAAALASYSLTMLQFLIKKENVHIPQNIELFLKIHSYQS